MSSAMRVQSPESAGENDNTGFEGIDGNQARRCCRNRGPIEVLSALDVILGAGGKTIWFWNVTTEESISA